ncbi:hypothetical protein, partial [Accumulibacter sp.]|uniref:hypothetical protein n=1 Tax=Accumulibacter sp. TaxID=2053492 RepID=UPI0025CBC6CE
MLNSSFFCQLLRARYANGTTQPTSCKKVPKNALNAVTEVNSVSTTASPPGTTFHLRDSTKTAMKRGMYKRGRESDHSGLSEPEHLRRIASVTPIARDTFHALPSELSDDRSSSLPTEFPEPRIKSRLDQAKRYSMRFVTAAVGVW